MEKTKLFIDCEFDGFGGELISMALYTGNEYTSFYVEIFQNNIKDDWVKENVIPKLNRGVRGGAVTKKHAAELLSDFLCDVSGEITIVADWHDDIKYFCDLINIAPGKSVPLPRKINFELDYNLSSKESKVPHNAFFDAMAIHDDYIKNDLK